MFTPGYRMLLERGELHTRIARLRELLLECCLCGRMCGVNRLAGERGYCGAGQTLEIASSCIHFGEEPVLTGNSGVGNIFTGRCNMKCIFCQNHSISQPEGSSPPRWERTAEELAEELLMFQEQGCPTAGFVSPTHFSPQLFEALGLAAERGFTLPLIYNTNGYDSIELLSLLDGLVDIYLPDFKYWREENGRIYSDSPDYPETAMNSIREMYRQVGKLRLNSGGTAVKGLLTRLLVLPEGLSGTEDVLRFIARELGTDVFISLMSQYFPAHKADCYPPLARKLYPEEYSSAVRVLEELEFENGWIQDPVSSPDSYRPGLEFEL